ncbi:enhancer of split malpha protein [Tribolium castaneum]|uniref:Uncharacterized protein n=1 Tax=Tribolium castaneum TaxID=7070 RepID=D6WXN2_TRICA|nr:PREDICTED: enhancer of split malpha protein [Tribolium castaneum]EFA08877.1 hypothetical protein TcasGA2_TC006578 [Tribolium castaneum]|eukprot:XP_008196966.1 PREDICTED: enhancer of split malpha protein [Tribolium castaneum]
MNCNDNSTNENLLNAKKARSAFHQLKKLISALVKKPKNSYKKSPDFDEIEDNLANELLENQIFEDIDSCEDFAAVPVYREGHVEVLPVCRGQRFVPVHFARTDAGTFFWTSMAGPDCDLNQQGDKNAITYYQQPELQVPAYRWAQA